MSRKTKIETPTRRIRKKPRKQSSPAPFIIGGVCAALILVVVIVAASSNKGQTVAKRTSPSLKANTTKKPETKKAEKANTKTQSPKQKPATAITKTPKEPNTATSETIEKQLGTLVKKNNPKPQTPDASSSTTSNKEKKTTLSPTEQSIARLKKIGSAYKEFASQNRGHMPQQLDQLSLSESGIISPLTSKPYKQTYEGMGAPLEGSLDYIVVREATPTDGKYLCLFGNGTVEAVDAADIEE